MSLLKAVTLSLLSLFIWSTNAAKFMLDTSSYPEVTDHHCIFTYCEGFTAGLHRDSNSGASDRNRRHAIGCDGVTDCRTSTTGQSCDEIPYASTFDGGLGCFSNDWTNSGRSINDLYNAGTHRCVDAGQNGAHGQALTTFYSRENVQNFEDFGVSLDLSNGCPDPRSTYCARLFNAIRAGQSTANICNAARNERSFAKLTSSAYTRPPRCPSRNYRRAKMSSWEDNLFNRSPDVSFPEFTADTVQVATLENGNHVVPMFGTHNVGDNVWIHDDTFENGTTSKIVGISSFKEHLNKFEKRQTCQT